jgi:hypothetical protein
VAGIVCRARLGGHVAPIFVREKRPDRKEKRKEINEIRKKEIRKVNRIGRGDDRKKCEWKYLKSQRGRQRNKINKKKKECEINNK